MIKTGLDFKLLQDNILHKELYYFIYVTNVHV